MAKAPRIPSTNPPWVAWESFMRERTERDMRRRRERREKEEEKKKGEEEKRRREEIGWNGENDGKDLIIGGKKERYKKEISLGKITYRTKTSPLAFLFTAPMSFEAYVIKREIRNKKTRKQEKIESLLPKTLSPSRQIRAIQ